MLGDDVHRDCTSLRYGAFGLGSLPSCAVVGERSSPEVNIEGN
jgi:hypothetical protein